MLDKNWPENSKHYINKWERFFNENPTLSYYGVEGWTPVPDEEQFGEEQEVW